MSPSTPNTAALGGGFMAFICWKALDWVNFKAKLFTPTAG